MRKCRNAEVQECRNANIHGFERKRDRQKFPKRQERQEKMKKRIMRRMEFRKMDLRVFFFVWLLLAAGVYPAQIFGPVCFAQSSAGEGRPKESSPAQMNGTANAMEPRLDLAPLEKRASEGAADAQAALGVFYVAGREVERDVKKGFEWLEKSAKQKDPRGTYYLAHCFLDGLGTKKNEKRGVELLEEAIRLRYVPAQMFLGKCLLYGRYGLKKDTKRGVELLTAAASEEDPEAQYLLGIVYSGMEKSIPANRQRQMKWLTLSAAHGFVPAQVALGEEYLKTGDEFWAKEWLEEAEDAGSAEAANLLGLQDLLGWPSGAQDLVSAQERLWKAAEAGIPEAQFVLGTLERELGNEAASVYWLQRATLQGHEESKKELQKTRVTAGSAALLGSVFLHGIGGVQDLKTARFWMEKSFGSGDPSYAYVLYYFEEYGIAGKKDPKRAIEIIKKGSEAGDPFSIYELAFCYCAGDGVQQDVKKALALIDQAEKNGDFSENLQFIRGLCAFFGAGMERDRKLALTLLQRAAKVDDDLANVCLHFLTVHPIPDEVVEPAEILERIRKEAEAGSPSAQYLMGQILMCGWRVKKDEAQAWEWIRKSAEKGYAPAQISLFFQYDWGVYTDRDPAEAVRWLRMAAEKGHPAALDILNLRQIPLADFLAPR